MYTIEAKNVNFFYGEFQALKNINLQVEKKTMLLLLSVHRDVENLHFYGY